MKKGDTEYLDVIENLNQMNLGEINLAKQHMRKWRWQECVEEASKELENLGISFEWFR